MVPGKNIKHPIPSLSEQYHFSVDNLESEINSLTRVGIKAILLFGVPTDKDAIGSSSFAKNNLITNEMNIEDIRLSSVIS